MTYVVLAALLSYELLVRVQMRKSPALRYNAVFARVLRVVLSKKKRCLSLWRTGWLLYNPETDVRGVLGPIPKKHELDGHILNPEQWAGHPRLFLFMYEIENAKWEWTYLRQTPIGKFRFEDMRKFMNDHNTYEEQARRIAGQPERGQVLTQKAA